MNARPLHRYVCFYQSENVFAFSATMSGAALIIDRDTAAISLQGSPLDHSLTLVLNFKTFPPPQIIYGIIGMIQLRLGNTSIENTANIDVYVIVVTGRESVGHLTAHEIFRLTKTEIIPLRLEKEKATKVPNPHLTYTYVVIGRR